MKPAFLLIFLSSAILSAQTNAPVKIYTSGPGITAPELLPHADSEPYVNDHCNDDEQGRVTFSLIVAPNGEPRNIYFLAAIGDDIDVLALKHITDDRFKAGTFNGQPVAVAESLDVFIRTCLRDEKDKNGQKKLVLHFSSAPQQTLKPPVDPPQQAVLVSGTGLSTNPSDPDPPVVKKSADSTAPMQLPPSDASFRLIRKVLGPGDFKVSVVVDRQGMPQRMKVLEAPHAGLEKQIASVVRLNRFKPAMQNGTPIPATTELPLGGR